MASVPRGESESEEFADVTTDGGHCARNSFRNVRRWWARSCKGNTRTDANASPREPESVAPSEYATAEIERRDGVK